MKKNKLSKTRSSVLSNDHDGCVPPNYYLRPATKKEQEKHNRLLKIYGITYIDWQEMSKYGCMICGIREGRLCVDHIHVAGFKKLSIEEKQKYVRGCLCFLCNTGIKGFDKTKDGEKNRKRLEGTYKYFQNYRLKGE